MSQFIYITDDQQIAFSASRNAIGEWIKGQNRWIFAGWMWDGEVRDVEHARELLTPWLALRGETL